MLYCALLVRFPCVIPASTVVHRFCLSLWSKGNSQTGHIGVGALPVKDTHQRAKFGALIRAFQTVCKEGMETPDQGTSCELIEEPAICNSDSAWARPQTIFMRYPFQLYTVKQQPKHTEASNHNENTKEKDGQPIENANKLMLLTHTHTRTHAHGREEHVR